MSGPHIDEVVMPIVIAVALFSWIFVVLRANRNPRWKHQSQLPRNEVTGGAFEAVDGGRQLMPRYGGTPLTDEERDALFARSRGVPAQRRPVTEQEAGSGRSASSGSAPGPEVSVPAQSAGERHPVEGTRLR
jgi:hypothetical protein